MKWLGCVLAVLSGCDAVVGFELPDAFCPASFDETGLFVVQSPLSWHEADAACRRMQPAESSRFTHLVVISDEAEAAQIAARTSDAWTWVGLQDFEAEGNFTWITDERTSAIPWDVGQPNEDPDYAQDCGALIGAAIQDKSCEGEDAPPGVYAPEWYVCECDAYRPVDPGA